MICEYVCVCVSLYLLSDVFYIGKIMFLCLATHKVTYMTLNFFSYLNQYMRCAYLRTYLYRIICIPIYHPYRNHIFLNAFTLVLVWYIYSHNILICRRRRYGKMGCCWKNFSKEHWTIHYKKNLSTVDIKYLGHVFIYGFANVDIWRHM